MSQVTRCPACGALPAERPDPDGHLQCAFCGVHYRLGAETATPRARRLWPLALGVAFALVLLGAALALYGRPAPRAGVGPANPRALPTPASGAEAVGELTATFAFHNRRPSVDDSFMLYGEVTNTSASPLRAVEVVAILRDAGETEVGSWNGYSMDDRLEPGAVSPVRILVKDPPKFQNIDFLVYARPAMGASSRVTSGLRVEPAEPTQQSVFQRLSGTVVNEGTAPVKLPKVTVIGRDAEGKILGIVETFGKDHQLQPGASSRWDTLANFGGVVAHVEYRASALPVRAP